MSPRLGLRGKGLMILGLVLPLCVGTGLAVAFRSNIESSAPESASIIHATPPAKPGPPESALPSVDDAEQLTGTAVSRSQFVWPTTGPMTSYLGPGHPTGVDIGMSYSEDSLVRAAAAGVVTFAGGDPCCEYGLHVEIDHGDGWSTLYGHFSKIGVKVGQQVDQGSLLGLGGQTGFATGKHLHFEIRQDEDNYVDPLRYLPPDQVRQRPMTAFSCPDAPITIDPASRLALSFTSTALQSSRLVSATVAPKNPGQGEPPLEATMLGKLDMVVAAAAPDNASGRVFDYDLALSFAADSGATTTFDCTLRLKTMQSFPTMTRVEIPVATPTRKPSTATPKPKTATPIPATRVPATSTPKPPTQTNAAPTQSQPQAMPGIPTSIPTAKPPGAGSPVATPKR